jgi:hypothetical protein
VGLAGGAGGGVAWWTGAAGGPTSSGFPVRAGRPGPVRWPVRCPRSVIVVGDAGDRLAGYPVAGDECGRCLGQRPYGPDDRLQAPGPYSFGEVGQLEPVRLDDDEDRPADGDQRSAGAYRQERVYIGNAADLRLCVRQGAS